MTKPFSQSVPSRELSSARLFPGKAILRVKEVAQVLDVHIDQIIKLIELGALEAMDISSPKRKDGERDGMHDDSGKPVPVGKKSSRRHWRIAAADLDRFISRRVYGG